MNSTEDLVHLFEDVQQSKRCHKTHLKKLCTFFNKLSSEDQQEVDDVLLCGILDQSLLYPKASAHVDRVLEFIAMFYAQAPEPLHGTLVAHLLQRVVSSHKHVRQRVCELLSHFLSFAAQQQIGLTVDVLTQMAYVVTTRLKDKIAGVRLSAVQTLRYLQDPEDVDDAVVAAMLTSLSSDPQASVRKAIIEAITLSEVTKTHIVRRILDIKAEVRAAVVSRLMEETDVRQFPKELRLLVVQHGLHDRDANVQQLTERLLLRWLCLIGNDVVKLLAYFSSNTQEDVMLLVGTALCEKVFAQTTTGLTEAEAASISAIRNTQFKWDALASGRTVANDLVSCELAWQYLRLRYAQNYLNTFSFMNACEEALPDVEVFVQSVIKVQGSVQSDGSLAAYKYLLLIAQLFVASCDVTAAARIEEMTFRLMRREKAQVDLLMLILQQIHLPASAPQSAFNAFIHKISTLVELLKAEEQDDSALQVAQWALMSPIVGKAVVQTHGLALRELILHGLQSTSVEMREVAMQTLGATCILSLRGADVAEETVQLFLGVAKHVATSNIEGSSVRAQSINVLIDLCLLSNDAIGVKDISMLLHGLLNSDSSQEELFPVALEGAVKLVFNGYLDAPEVVHRLLAHFFLPTSSSTPASQRAQQVLSLFLSACLTTPVPKISEDTGEAAAAGKTCVDVLCESLSLFVSDFTTRVRDQVLEPSKMQHVVSNLLGLVSAAIVSESSDRPGAAVYNQSLELASHSLQVALFGNICRELLKMNMADKEDKVIFKEYSKIVCGLEIYERSPVRESRTALKIMAALHEQLLNSSSSAKPAASHTAQLRAYQQWMSRCHHRTQGRPVEQEDSEQSERLLRWACGLSDLLQLTQPSWDEPSMLLVDMEDDAPRARRTKTKATVKTAKKIVEESEVEESEEEGSDSEGSEDYEHDDDDDVVDVPFNKNQ